MKIASALFLIACFFMTMTSPSHAGERYIAILGPTAHFGNDNLNGKTPGLTLGKRWQGKAEGSEWFYEFGLFYNSYEEMSPIALLGTSRHIGTIDGWEVRAGLAAGTAYYKEQSRVLEAKYGIPNIAGFIPVVAASLAFRHDRDEIRLTTVPPDQDTSFILNISWARIF